VKISSAVTAAAWPLGEQEMSTLPIQAANVPQVWPIAGFGRVIAAVMMVLDVFVEVQQQATAAHKRYPFAEW
jgi:hypothetical protein